MQECSFPGERRVMISISRSYAISFLLLALMVMSPLTGLAGPVSKSKNPVAARKFLTENNDCIATR